MHDNYGFRNGGVFRALPALPKTLSYAFDQCFSGFYLFSTGQAGAGVVFEGRVFVGCEPVKEVVVESFFRDVAERKERLTFLPAHSRLRNDPFAIDAAAFVYGDLLCGEDGGADWTGDEMVQQFEANAVDQRWSIEIGGPDFDWKVLLV